MPPRKQSGRTATLASLMAAGVSAPTLALAEDGLGLSPDAVEWAPAPLRLVANVDEPESTHSEHVPPRLHVLPEPSGA